MANDQIKKADNGTYYFRANLGFDHSTGKRIQKYRSGFKTKKKRKRNMQNSFCNLLPNRFPPNRKGFPSERSLRTPTCLGIRHR